MSGDTQTCGNATWTFTAGDVKVEVTATIVEGKVVFDFKLVEGTADLNGAFFDWMGDGGKVKSVEGEKANNMNGSDSDGNKIAGFDEAVKLGSVGGNDPDVTQKDVEFDLAKMKVNLGLNLDAKDEDVLQALAENTIIGIRATSVGDDREDSLKMTAEGEYCPPEEDECTDFFPDMDKGISHVTFVWAYDKETAPKELSALDKNDDGYITVKVDIPGSEDDDPADLGACGNDLDTWYKAALADIYASEDYGILVKADFEGAYIKSGRDAFSPDSDPNIWDGDPGNALNSLAFFSVEDVQENDNGNDARPDGMGEEVVTVRGNGTEVTSLTNYTDGHTFEFNQDWVPEECDCVA